MISHRMLHLLVVHILIIPSTLGYVYYGIYNGFMFIPLFAIHGLTQFILGGIFAIFVQMGIYFEYEGYKHYKNWDNWIENK